MSIFAVVLDEPTPEISEHIKNEYPGSYQFSDSLFFLSSDQIADDVARALGITSDDESKQILGAVFRLNHSYAGYTRRALWDWLTQAEKQG